MKEDVEKLRAKLNQFVTEAIKRAGLTKEGYKVAISNIYDPIAFTWAYRQGILKTDLSYNGSVSWEDAPSETNWDIKLANFTKALKIQYGKMHKRNQRISYLENKLRNSIAGKELAKLAHQYK